MRAFVVAMAAALAVGCLGCGAELNFAYMSTDSSGNIKTTKFRSVGDEIFCVMEMIGGDEETVLSFGLNSPDGTLKLSDNDLYPRPDPSVQGPVRIWVQLLQYDAMGGPVTDGPWPTGGYSLDVAIDGEVAESVDFSVVP